MTNDAIADMLTRIRNGGMASHTEVVMPASRISLNSMFEKPATAPIGKPSLLRDSGGNAWKARKM